MPGTKIDESNRGARACGGSETHHSAAQRLPQGSWSTPKPPSASRRRPKVNYANDAAVRLGVCPARVNPSKIRSTPASILRPQINALAEKHQILRLQRSDFGQCWDQIVAGHARLEAARLVGLQEVPTLRLEHLSEQQAKAYMLADNKLTDRSGWDDAKVAIILKDLSEMALEFEIEATGFETAEIDLRIQSLDPSEDAPDSANEFERSVGPPVSRLGDLWRLGRHSLVCGSALDSRCLRRTRWAPRRPRRSSPIHPTTCR